MDLKVKIGDRIKIIRGDGEIAEVVGIDVPGTRGYVVQWEDSGHTTDYGSLPSFSWEKVGSRRTATKRKRSKRSYASRSKPGRAGKRRTSTRRNAGGVHVKIKHGRALHARGLKLNVTPLNERGTRYSATVYDPHTNAVGAFAHQIGAVAQGDGPTVDAAIERAIKHYDVANRRK